MTTASIDILDEETCDYYYGGISRETAEYILWDKGCLDSMFLIRKSNSDYVLSLCYQKSILHYRISYLGNGEVMLHGYEAQKFSSIDHLLGGVEGLAIKPGLPCERSSGWQLPPTYWGLTVSEIRSAIIAKSHEWGFTEALVTFPIEYLSLGNDDYNRCILTEVTKSLINKTLHEIQPWFHGRLTRLEAEKSLEESGHKEGKFLVRERDESSYALCVSHEGTAKHYRIDILSSSELAIQDGHKFPSIMSLVSHYTVFTDGLWTSLGEPCPPLNNITPSQLLNYNNSSNGDLILQNTLRNSSTNNATMSANSTGTGGGVSACSRHNCPSQQQQQQYQMQQSSGRGGNTTFYRTMSTERNRNYINSHSRSSTMRGAPPSSVKLKEWMSTINHKWSQLISAVTPKNGSNESSNNTLSNKFTRRAHHFSTLPRNHPNHHGGGGGYHQQHSHHLSQHHQHGQQGQYYQQQQQLQQQHQHLQSTLQHRNSQQQPHGQLQYIVGSHQYHPNPNLTSNLSNQQQHQYQRSNQQLINQQSIYDYAVNGHQNSLNFRSLNVEINSPWINPGHNFLLNRATPHLHLLNSQRNSEIITESNHYQETDLFPRSNSGTQNSGGGHGENNDHHHHHHQVPTSGQGTGDKEKSLQGAFLKDDHQHSRQQLIIDSMKATLIPDDINSMAMTIDLGKANGGSNNGTSGPYLVKGIIKSSSLEDIYTTTSNLLISSFDHHVDNSIIINNNNMNNVDQQNKYNAETTNQTNHHHLSSSSGSSFLIPPIPVPRRSKPGLLGLMVKPMVQYANQEVIKLYNQVDDNNNNGIDGLDLNQKQKSNQINDLPDECKDSDEYRSDLLLFDEIKGDNDDVDDVDADNLRENCNQQIKTLIELITDGYFNQTFRGSNWPTTPHTYNNDNQNTDNIKVTTNNSINSNSNSSADHSTAPVITLSTHTISSSSSPSVSSSSTIVSTCDTNCLNNNINNDVNLYACQSAVQSVNSSNFIVQCRPVDSCKVLIHENQSACLCSSSSSPPQPPPPPPPTTVATFKPPSETVMDSNQLNTDIEKVSSLPTATASTPTAISTSTSTSKTTFASATVTTVPTTATTTPVVQSTESVTVKSCPPMAPMFSCPVFNEKVTIDQLSNCCISSMIISECDHLSNINDNNPNYEEINEELMKEIEATRPSIEVLREFDTCFNMCLPNSEQGDKRRASEPSIGQQPLSSAFPPPQPGEDLYTKPEIKRKVNKPLGQLGRSMTTSAAAPSSSNTSTHWTSVDASGVNVQMYDYDALKFDRDFIVKEASLGLTSLEPTQSGSQVKLNQLDLICLEEDPEEVNKSLTRYRQGPISLDPKFITLQKPLGNGYFGEVFLGTIPSSSGCASIQVAVKVLKLKAIPNHKSEILREAQTMSALDHKHIVRLIGVCEADPIMIVMELAPLGPLNQYLLDHGFSVTIRDIIALLLQVALAMQYLESKQFIHRDLAARNVLLVNEKFAKVSDFGMSRALGIGKEYYKAKSASKWPLKWYAPECIYYFKFSTKSDVWSYGVTMWESLSYGQKPYEGMDGQDILRLFRENRRLPKPDNCPQEIYQLMWKCWQFRPEDRPTFAEICQTMTTYFLCSNI